MNDFYLLNMSKRLYQSISIEHKRFTSNIHMVCYSIGSLTHLQKLYASGNELDTLPEWLGSLSSLRELKVSHCQLSSLPGRWVICMCREWIQTDKICKVQRLLQQIDPRDLPICCDFGLTFFEQWEPKKLDKYRKLIGYLLGPTDISVGSRAVAYSQLTDLLLVNPVSWHVGNPHISWYICWKR